MIFYIITMGSGLLLMWFLNKYSNKNDTFWDKYYEWAWPSENLSMDGHHTMFHSYYRKEPAGCFLVAGLLIVGGIAGVLGSIGYYLFRLIFQN